jgi:16S rRNA (guanine966-N2)-methyltransferase
MSKKRNKPSNGPKRDVPASGRRQLQGKSATPADQAVVGLRIIGGSLRGRKLEYSGDMRTRPMKDRVREAVFNLLGYTVGGSHVIDLFAGTGAMAIEAISRGAAKATCIERHFPTSKLIEKGAAGLGIADRMTVIFGDAFFWTKNYTCPPDSAPLIIFCSPPYDFFSEREPAMLELIACWARISPPKSQIVVEADDRFDFSHLPEPAHWDIRAYPPAFVGIWEKTL